MSFYSKAPYEITDKQAKDAADFAIFQARERNGYWRANERGPMRKGLQQAADVVQLTRDGTLYIGDGWGVELI